MSITDTEANGGGTWNNDSPGNWAIWYAAGNTTSAVTAPTFLNNSGAHPPLNVSIPLPLGTSSYTLYKAENGSGFDSLGSDVPLLGWSAYRHDHARLG